MFSETNIRRVNIPAWKFIVDGLKGQCYLSRNDYDCKISAGKQRSDIGKYCFVYRTIKLWNQMPVEALVVFHSNSHTFICE